MEYVKVVLDNGNEPIVPVSNLETFRRIFFNNIIEIIYPDKDGKFKESTKKTNNSVDVSKAISSLKAENDALEKENELLKASLDQLNNIVDTTTEKTAKSKTKKTK